MWMFSLKTHPHIASDTLWVIIVQVGPMQLNQIWIWDILSQIGPLAMGSLVGWFLSVSIHINTSILQNIVL